MKNNTLSEVKEIDEPLYFAPLIIVKILRHIYHLTMTERVKTLPVLLTSVCKVNCAGIYFQTVQASCLS